MTASGTREGTGLTEAQRVFLFEAACNHLGVAKIVNSVGYAKRSRREMAARLCASGLMCKYVHGSDEYQITEAGRSVLSTEGR